MINNLLLGRKRIFLALAASALLSFSSCQTAKYPISESPALQKGEINGIDVECLYLDEAVIKTRHGSKNNPFLPVPMIFTPQPAIIFELKIINKDSAPLKIDMRDVEFYYNDKSYRPMSKLDMEIKIDDTAEKGTDRVKQKRIAKAYMLGDIKKIEGNSEAKGYIVYMAGFKDRGKADLTLFFKSLDNIDAGEIKFNYNFKLKLNRR